MSRKISVCHTTARPEKWFAAYQEWTQKAAFPLFLEYVLCVDERWGFNAATFSAPEGVRVVWNAGRKCCVDGWNTAFQAASGCILVMVADDYFPPQDWDIEILRAVNGLDPLQDDFAVRLGSNNPNQGRDLWGTCISRKRYERLGYALYPEYESMYADDDDCEHIKLDVAEGRTVLVDARHIVCFDANPAFGTAASDPVYEHQARSESWTVGKGILERRRRAKFDGIAPVRNHRTIGLCLPGENFSGMYFASIFKLVFALIAHRWEVRMYTSYSSSSSVTRASIAAAALGEENPVDLLLWLDDDNLVTFEQLEILVADLDLHPEAALVGGWCYIAANAVNPTMASCGAMNGNIIRPLQDGVFLDGVPKLLDVQFTGFPCILMRREVLERLGPQCFAFMGCPESRWGYIGEDVAFCMRATAAGYKLYIDTRVHVPHLKLAAVKPDPKDEPIPALAEVHKREVAA